MSRLFQILIAVAVCAAVAPAVVESANWAVLISGSNGYWNYRHHADVGHAYSILKGQGIPDNNIIVMVYDDVAKSSNNPFPGQIFNAPTPAGTPGVDVWANLKKDYVGKDVTAKTFQAVLTGNSTAVSGPVLKTGPGDNVFIYFTDHGSVGSIAMPAGPALRVDELRSTLTYMHANNLYKNLVFYLEACESGSMFEGWLPNNMNIWATTAANGRESSWGWYCNPNDKVNGKSVGSCLGDEYSINWLEDTDRTGVTQSLQKQYETVKRLTTKSHVQLFGSTELGSLPLSDFISNAGKKKIMIGAKKTVAPRDPVAAAAAASEAYGVDSRDIKLDFLVRQYVNQHEAKTENFKFSTRYDSAMELVEEIKHRVSEDMRYRHLATLMVDEDQVEAAIVADNGIPAIECGQCCTAAYDVIYSRCGGFSDYSLKYGRLVHNLCTMKGFGDLTQRMVGALKSTCKNF